MISLLSLNKYYFYLLLNGLVNRLFEKMLIAVEFISINNSQEKFSNNVSLIS